jgi:hypothetical protein
VFQESAALPRGRDGHASKERSVAPRTGRSCLKGARRCLEEGTVMRQRSAALPRGRDERASPAGNVATRHLGARASRPRLMIGILLRARAGETPAVPGTLVETAALQGSSRAARAEIWSRGNNRQPTTDNRQRGEAAVQCAGAAPHNFSNRWSRPQLNR